MGKIKERITILAIGDNADHDSYRKLHKEKPFILQSGFGYETASYKQFLTKGPPSINTKKIIIFLFFPFVYWNKYIEHKNYKGIYGSRVFFDKFSDFWNEVHKTIKRSLKGKDIFFINHPSLCGLYRDKLKVAKKFSRAGIPNPKIYNASRIKSIEMLLSKGHSLFLKPRYGSMGKGITFLSWSNWQTNFMFKEGDIRSRPSDHGWKFREITGNRRFLSKLLKEDILVNEAIDSLILKKMKIDMRIYTFFGKVVYVYPRKNRVERITTNISQGAHGDPNILKELPRDLIAKAKGMACRASRALGLNLIGMDVMIDHNLKDIYVLDANVFPGFPKRRTFNLAQYIIRELVRLDKKKKLHFEKV